MDSGTYINPFYSRFHQGGREFFYVDKSEIIYYKGYEIHKKSIIEFHIVKDSVCIGMMAGINGAKYRIDELNKN